MAAKIRVVYDAATRQQTEVAYTDQEIIDELPPYLGLSLDAAQISQGGSTTLYVQLMSQQLADDSRVNIEEARTVVIQYGAATLTIQLNAQGYAEGTINGTEVGSYEIKPLSSGGDVLYLEVV
jgi:hypothetical protein